MAELLDLATVVERDTVRIRTKKNPNGRLYELLNFDDLGPYEHQVIRNGHEKVQKLNGAARKLTDVEKRALRKALDDIVAALVPSIEPATLKEMENVQKAAIATAWAFKVNADAVSAEGNAPAAPEKKRTPPRRTTRSSSQRSSGSTAATPKRGGTPPRG